MHPVERLLSPLWRALRKRRPDPAKSLADVPDAAGTASADALRSAAAGHVLARGTLMGTRTG